MNWEGYERKKILPVECLDDELSVVLGLLS